MTDQQRREEHRRGLTTCMVEAAGWIAQAEVYLKAIFPKGSRVEVRLRYGQHNWSTARVAGVQVDATGADLHARVQVRLDDVSLGPRAFRTINLADIRPLQDHQ